MLVKFRGVSLKVGAKLLLDEIDLTINAGDRLCLLGKNGAGKSSFLKLLTQELKPDAGGVEFKKGLRIANLTQIVPSRLTGRVYDVLCESVGQEGTLLLAYEKALVNNDEQAIVNLQQELQNLDAWQLQTKLKTIMSKLHLNADDEYSQLSGGWRRRVLLAQALLAEPDLLILDEPTNHLDVESIVWLEQLLVNLKKTIIFVSHDRRFVEKVATRFVELDFTLLTEYSPNFEKYLQEKQALLDNRELQAHKLQKKLQVEEKWMRQGISARRKRNQGRVRALKSLRQQVSSQSKSQTANLRLSQASLSGKVVIEAQKLNFNYENQALINDFSIRILRGEKIGVIGPNGCGKTSLLKLLLKEMASDSGDVIHGTQLSIAYLDQLRDQIDDEKTVLDNVAMGQTHIELNGVKVHAFSYLNDFLFSSEKIMQKAKILSGGEKARLLLAKIFTLPANVLVFDEPTNDLDIETLELLESLLLEFKGTVLIVSHDREFLNRVCSSNIIFMPHGKLEHFVGAYDDYLQSQRQQLPKAEKKPITKVKTKKLSYKQKLELEALPQKIEQLEQEIEQLNTEMASAEFYQQAPELIKKRQVCLQNAQKMLEMHYKKWEELDALS